MNVYILIDQSGSMMANWSETIGAVNAYARGLIDAKISKLRFNVAAFDASGVLRFAELRRDVKAKEWADITETESYPQGLTPLFDAIGRISQWVRDDKPKKAAIAIITDGAENASREVTKDAAKTMLDKMRDDKFDVVFLGADFDAFGEAASVGVGAGQTLNMAKGNYAAASASLASRSVVYARTGDNTKSWSSDDRKRASGTS